MESKEDFFLAKSVWFSYLKHVCVCVRMHVSVCRMVMFNLLESHSNTLSPISSKKFFRTACYRFQEPQVQVVQTMVVNQLCLLNPLTSSETYDIGAVSWRFCVRNQLIGFLKHEETQENWKNCMHFHQERNRDVTHDDQTVDHHVNYIQWWSPQWSDSKWSICTKSYYKLWP